MERWFYSNGRWWIHGVLVLLLLSAVWGSSVQSVSAQTSAPPSPKVLRIDYPSQITLGEYVQITVEATNNGAQADWQTIAISFPDPVNDIAIAGDDLGNAKPWYPGDELGASYCQQKVKLRYPVVEGSRSPWDSGLVRYLRVKVKPANAGSFRFYVKSVAGKSSINFCGGDPKSGTIDQQGEYVYVKTVQVIPPMVKPMMTNLGISRAESNVPESPPVATTIGGRFKAWCTVQNPNPYDITVGFGLSIRLPGGAIISDPENDQTFTIRANSTERISRLFTVRSNAVPGTYNVIYGLWSGMPGSSTRYTEEEKQGWLKVESRFTLTLTSATTDGKSDLGQIWFKGTKYNLPASVTTEQLGPTGVEAYPPGGYVFERWETSGGVRLYQDYGSGTASITVNGSGVLKAVFKPFTPPGEKVPTRLTVKVEPSAIPPVGGSRITVSGKLTRSDTGAGVGEKSITLILPGVYTYARTDSNGSYSYSYEAPKLVVGPHQITARFDGDSSFGGCQAEATLTVGLIDTAISITLSPSTVTSGKPTEVRIIGRLTDSNTRAGIPNRQVELQWPEGKVSVLTSATGEFSHSVTVATTQNWVFQATFAGDSAYSQSWNKAVLNVVPPQPSKLTASLSVAPDSGDTSASFTFTVTVQGGTPPYIVHLRDRSDQDIALPQSASSTTYTFTRTFSPAGAYYVHAFVQDAEGSTTRSDDRKVVITEAPASLEQMALACAPLLSWNHDDGYEPQKIYWQVTDLGDKYCFKFLVYFLGQLQIEAGNVKLPLGGHIHDYSIVHVVTDLTGEPEVVRTDSEMMHKCKEWKWSTEIADWAKDGKRVRLHVINSHHQIKPVSSVFSSKQRFEDEVSKRKVIMGDVPIQYLTKSVAEMFYSVPKVVIKGFGSKDVDILDYSPLGWDIKDPWYCTQKIAEIPMKLTVSTSDSGDLKVEAETDPYISVYFVLMPSLDYMRDHLRTLIGRGSSNKELLDALVNWSWGNPNRWAFVADSDGKATMLVDGPALNRYIDEYGYKKEAQLFAIGLSITGGGVSRGQANRMVSRLERPTAGRAKESEVMKIIDAFFENKPAEALGGRVPSVEDVLDYIDRYFGGGETTVALPERTRVGVTQVLDIIDAYFENKPSAMVGGGVPSVEDVLDYIDRYFGQ